MSDRETSPSGTDRAADTVAPALGGVGPRAVPATPGNTVEGTGVGGTGTVTGGVTGDLQGVPPGEAQKLERIGDDQNASPGAVGANTSDTGESSEQSRG